ncbi:MAG: UDP-N-acetylglucosamine 1-carboxyvinyltransferase [Patescibacteria group bacterium]
MYQYIIKGKQTLRGAISVYGDKNTALKLIPSTILSDEKCVISNIPDITDIKIMIEIMQDLGVAVNQINADTYEFEAKNIKKTELNIDLAKKLRASTVLIGPMLAKFGEITLPHPGGCIIGQRPIDVHLDAFQKMGAAVIFKKDSYRLVAKKLTGAKIAPPLLSVTATENIILGAVLAAGTTTIEYAACEPSIVQLAEFLIARGAKISGAGSPRIIIEGVSKLNGGEIKVIPDRIEAGTYVILGALCGEELVINNCQPSHLEVVLAILKSVGVDFDCHDHSIVVRHSPKLTAKDMITNPYPGFPTDLQAPYTVLMTQAQGLCMIRETIFEGRLNYTEWLNKMGANIINCDPHRAIISGPTPLFGKKIISPDIRAGIALIIAALLAQGQSQIDNIDLVDRGYANLDQRLSILGASIERREIK